jgi:CRP-like cAMP-binding protein
MSAPYDVLARKLQKHSHLSAADLAALRSLPYTERTAAPNEDIVRQGDKPAHAVIVLRGMVARYHTLSIGRRQYLSLHIAGDMPDAQSLFIETMDHAVCAIDEAAVAMVPHAAMLPLFEERPSIASAVWRETLIDAAIFRETITNNSARPLTMRLAHFFCEQYYRSRAGGHSKPGSCSLPLTQTQIAEALGSSLPSVSRALKALRRTKLIDLRGGELHVRDWSKLARTGDFNPGYLHLRAPSRL